MNDGFRIDCEWLAAERLLPALNIGTHRQKFQRAFAGAFLCPYPALRDFLGTGPSGDDAIEDAADHFNVSPLLIRTVLVNKHELERGSLAGTGPAY